MRPRGGEVNCLDVILHVEMKRSNMIPEAGFGENRVYPLPAVVMYAAHKIGVTQVNDFALMIAKKAVNSFVRTPFESIQDNLFLKE